jgi:hypothetical protein
MKPDMDRNLGEQPIARVMIELGLKAQDLVAASTEQITHKMVGRACKGRWLTPNVRLKILNALNKASGREFVMTDCFTYCRQGDTKTCTEPS